MGEEKKDGARFSFGPISRYDVFGQQAMVDVHGFEAVSGSNIRMVLSNEELGAIREACGMQPDRFDDGIGFHIGEAYELDAEALLGTGIFDKGSRREVDVYAPPSHVIGPRQWKAAGAALGAVCIAAGCSDKVDPVAAMDCGERIGYSLSEPKMIAECLRMCKRGYEPAGVASPDGTYVAGDPDTGFMQMTYGCDTAVLADASKDGISDLHGGLLPRRFGDMTAWRLDKDMHVSFGLDMAAGSARCPDGYASVECRAFAHYDRMPDAAIRAFIEDMDAYARGELTKGVEAAIDFRSEFVTDPTAIEDEARLDRVCRTCTGQLPVKQALRPELWLDVDRAEPCKVTVDYDDVPFVKMPFDVYRSCERLSKQMGIDGLTLAVPESKFEALKELFTEHGKDGPKGCGYMLQADEAFASPVFTEGPKRAFRAENFVRVGGVLEQGYVMDGASCTRVDAALRNFVRVADPYETFDDDKYVLDGAAGRRTADMLSDLARSMWTGDKGLLLTGDVPDEENSYGPLAEDGSWAPRYLIANSEARMDGPMEFSRGGGASLREDRHDTVLRLEKGQPMTFVKNTGGRLYGFQHEDFFKNEERKELTPVRFVSEFGKAITMMDLRAMVRDYGRSGCPSMEHVPEKDLQAGLPQMAGTLARRYHYEAVQDGGRVSKLEQMRGMMPADGGRGDGDREYDD